MYGYREATSPVTCERKDLPVPLKSALARIAAVFMMVASTIVIGQAPASAQAAPVAGGDAIVLNGYSICTLGATGFDNTGRAIAFTAGHCSENIGDPVALRDNEAHGQIGQVVARNEVLDYAVIELSPNVVPVRQPGIAGRGGTPHLGEVVCKVGASTGHACGVTWESDGPWFWNQACAGPGDSGGPMMVGDRLVGLLSGGGMPPITGAAGSLAYAMPPCLHPAQSPFFLPGLAVSFDAIVDDATHRDWPGAGFTLA